MKNETKITRAKVEINKYRKGKDYWIVSEVKFFESIEKARKFAFGKLKVHSQALKNNDIAKMTASIHSIELDINKLDLSGMDKIDIPDVINDIKNSPRLSNLIDTLYIYDCDNADYTESNEEYRYAKSSDTIIKI